MTPQQEHIALQNFKTSMIQSGHGDRIDYNHKIGYFDDAATHVRWLGYKRCWEEQVLKEGATKTTVTDTTCPAPVNVAPDYQTSQVISRLTCPKCTFQLPPDTACKPVCPNCRSALNVATDFLPPDPNTEEFVFVGGPLHGLHHMDPNIPWLVTEQNNVQYLYTKVRPAWAGCKPRDNTPFVFVIFATHTLR